MRGKWTFFLTFLLLACPAWAGEEKEALEPEQTEQDEQYRSGYGKDRYFGGPGSVGDQLKEADRIKKPVVHIPAMDTLFQPWYDWKKHVKEETGLSFGFRYTSIYQAATESMGEDQAAGSVFQFQTQWTLLGKGTDDTGSLVFQVWNRHKLWTDIPPASLGSEIGSVTATTFGFADTGWGVPQLYWQQMWNKGGAAILAGQLQPIVYLDSYPLVNPLTGFFNQTLGFNATIPIPSSGLGVAGGALLTDKFYFAGSLTDANGSTNRAGFDTFFRDREYFKHLELGFTPSLEDIRKHNAHITLWHVDEREDAMVPRGYGITSSMHTRIDDHWLPFLRAGYSTGDAAPLQATVSAGAGYYLRDNNDVLAAGLGWGNPSQGGLDFQYTLEVYYKLQLAQNISISPDVQLIIDPALNPDENLIGVFGLRARLTF